MLKILESISNDYSNVSVYSIVWAVTALGLFCIYQICLKLKIQFWESAITYISGLFFLLLAYAPLTNSYFVFHDDFYFWAWQKGMCNTHPQYLFLLVIGRPLSNVVVCPLGTMIDSLDSANFVRLISIFLTSIVFFLINRYLIYLEFKKLVAYGLSLIIVTGFSFHVYNTWIMTAYMPVAIIFSIFSIWLAEKLVRESSRYAHRKDFNLLLLVSKIKFILFFVSSIIFYILTLSTYQPSAGFFTCFVAISFLREKKLSLNLFAIKSMIFGGIFLISNALYFLILRVLISLFAFEQFSTEHDPRVLGDLYGRIFERLLWFVKVPFANSLNFIDIESKILTPILILLFVLSIIVLLSKDLGSIVSFSHKNNKLFYIKNKVHLLLVIYKYFIAIFCIPLSYLAIIVSRNSDINQRTLVPLTAFVLITIIISIEFILNFIFSRTKFTHYFKNVNGKIVLLPLLAFICSVNIFNTNLRLQNLAIAYSSEIHYLKYKINSIPEEIIQNVQAIKVTTHSNYPPILSNSISELNAYSSRYPQNIAHILTCVFSEVNSSSQKPKMPPIVTVYNSSGEHIFGVDLSKPESPKISDENTLVIDMNELNLF
ncbi:hypothetical protein [Spirulina sp. 06S082]|uniref:hypothetical protein n=1 Tax=Spirulina sp. 06S082 TaxID=3110248 RepID=UPI002B1FCD2A|nr:hypothetical protein [Spirulina sp. 06S082]MEA5468201.1 hypothetical protein [Spirulina sp. 06S082]